MEENKLLELTLKANIDQQSPVKLLTSQCDLSSAEIKSAMTKGAVWIKRMDNRASTANKHHKAVRLRRASALLSCGDLLLMNYDSAVLAQTAQPPKLVEDQGGFSVWDKPAGMLCQGSRWSDHTTLNRWIESEWLSQRRAFLVHRLDRMTSGLTVVAHNKKMAANLARQFQERVTTKRYRVVVMGECELACPYVIDEPLDGKHAVTIIERSVDDWVSELDLNETSPHHWPNSVALSRLSLPFTKLEVSIQTGRKHQIRRHLAGLGFSVIGDRLYGDTKQNLIYENVGIDMQLQSCRLSFLHPETRTRQDYCL